jgi:polyisoprenoid-binding protein YceI
MKAIVAILSCLFFVGVAQSQKKYLTKSGAVHFYSKTLVEDITADNTQVLSIIDASNGKMAIQILMKSFLFEKALMQEHFNENYVESDRYPKALFKGEILNFDAVGEAKSSQQVQGDLTLHGVTKNIVVEANFIKTNEAILVEGDFFVKLADYNIKIPSVVGKKIAENIKVTFTFKHEPYKK